MDGSLKFADYVTIAVIVALVVLGVQRWQKSKGGCGCGPKLPAQGGDTTTNLNRRVGMRSCA